MSSHGKHVQISNISQKLMTSFYYEYKVHSRVLMNAFSNTLVKYLCSKTQVLYSPHAWIFYEH